MRVRPQVSAERRGLTVASVAIAIAVFLQDHGRVVADTKVDLAIDPQRFLERAIHLWDPVSGFGQIGNQTAGYLFPMGPAFLAGRAASIPPWVMQRAWVTGVLVLALWGTARLARALGVGTPASRVVGGLAYALAPAMLATVGIASGGQLPAALAPWAIVPLVHGGRGGAPRVAAARSALVVAAMGGVNAVSTFAATGPAALFLLTRGHGRARLIAWWVPCVALATAWWTVPLLVQARYGIDFLAYTEDASTTTVAASTPEILRGTAYWLGYLFDDGPWIRGAWSLVSDPIAIAGSSVVAAAGLWGLARRDVPERLFLVTSAVIGAVLMGAAYSGSLGGPFSSPLGNLLDGPLGPFRNVQKLDAALRLPLCLGLAHGMAVATGAVASARLTLGPPMRWASAIAAITAVTAAALPLPRGELFPAGSFVGLPSHWRELAEWLGHEDRGRAVILPSAAFAEYRWGRPLDEPMASLAASPWAVRNLIPLGSIGSTRILDEIERRLDRGEPPPGLADMLRRLGVGSVVVRADLDPILAESIRPVYVVEALRRTPGLVHAASFGGITSAPTTTDRLARRDVSAHEPALHSLEVFTVSKSSPLVRAPVGPPVRVAGGPESIVQAADAGVLGDRAAVLVGDVGDPGPGGQNEPVVVLTDAFTRRDEEFGRIADGRSAVLAEGERLPGVAGKPRQRMLDGWRAATARFDGAAGIRSSSYGSNVIRQPESAPSAAFDHNPSSAWLPGPRQAGEWIEVTFEHAMPISEITLSLLRDVPDRPMVRQVAITTDAGSSIHALDPVSAPQRLEFPGKRTKRLRLTLLRISRTFSAASAGVTEISIPGVSIERLVSLPATAGPVEAVLLDRSRRDPRDATRNDEEPALVREFVLDASESFDVSGTLTEDAIVPGSAGPVRASSTWADLSAFGVDRAFDDSPDTSWIAAPHDESPSVLLRWPQPVVLSRVEVDHPPGPFLQPTRVRITTPAGDREAPIERGQAVFDPIATDTALLSFPEVSDASIRSVERGLVLPAALALSTLTLDAPPPSTSLTAADAAKDPCDSGPVIEVDGRAVRTRVTSTTVVSGAPAVSHFRSCGPVTLGTGGHVVRTRAASRVGTVVLARARPFVPTPSRSTVVRTWARDRRVIAVGPGDAAILVVSESANEGWQAELAGKRLDPVVVDGWSQGFRLPAGSAGEVTLALPAARVYRGGIAAGAIGLLLVMLLALRRCRFRSTQTAALPRRVHPAVAVAAVTAGAGTLAGPVILVVPVAVAARRKGLAAPLAALCSLGAGALTLLDAGAFPSTGRGPFGGVAQFLGVTAVVLASTNLLDEQES